MLNQDQEKALKEFISFIAKPHVKHMVLSGPAGAGKGYLLRHIQENWERVSLLATLLNSDACVMAPEFTATTNEAVYQLGIESACTIYSRAGLIPGYKGLRAIRAPDRLSRIIVVDESSYVDEDAFNKITQQLPNCKFVWVMDQDQLAPVGSAVPYVTTQEFDTSELTIIERNKGALQDLVRELRHGVRNQHGVDIRSHHNGTTIQVVNEIEFQNQIIKEFGADYTQCKVVMFKNNTVNKYNNAIHENVLGNPRFPHDGAPAIINSYSKEAQYRVGTRLTIHEVYEEVVGYQMYTDIGHTTKQVEQLRIQSSIGGITCPVHKDDKQVWKLSNWFVDIALPYASTTHKAQGSTIPVVFVDAKDIFSSWDDEMRRRLIYVAVSRASERVVICL